MYAVLFGESACESLLSANNTSSQCKLDNAVCIAQNCALKEFSHSPGRSDLGFPFKYCAVAGLESSILLQRNARPPIASTRNLLPWHTKSRDPNMHTVMFIYATSSSFPLGSGTLEHVSTDLKRNPTKPLRWEAHTALSRNGTRKYVSSQSALLQLR